MRGPLRPGQVAAETRSRPHAPRARPARSAGPRAKGGTAGDGTRYVSRSPRVPLLPWPFPKAPGGWAAWRARRGRPAAESSSHVRHGARAPAGLPLPSPGFRSSRFRVQTRNLEREGDRREGAAPRQSRRLLLVRSAARDEEARRLDPRAAAVPSRPAREDTPPRDPFIRAIRAVGRRPAGAGLEDEMRVADEILDLLRREQGEAVLDVVVDAGSARREADLADECRAIGREHPRSRGVSEKLPKAGWQSECAVFVESSASGEEVVNLRHWDRHEAEAWLRAGDRRVAWRGSGVGADGRGTSRERASGSARAAVRRERHAAATARETRARGGQRLAWRAGRRRSVRTCAPNRSERPWRRAATASLNAAARP